MDSSIQGTLRYALTTLLLFCKTFITQMSVFAKRFFIGLFVSSKALGQIGVFTTVTYSINTVVTKSLFCQSCLK